MELVMENKPAPQAINDAEPERGGEQSSVTRTEDLYEKYREPISRLTLMDDLLMTRVFDGNTSAVQYVLRTILNKGDLVVKSVEAQKVMKNLAGRSVVLDILAEDARGLSYNIEIQKDDRGAHPKRARYHSALIDSTLLKPGTRGFKMPESYVIFITENDVLKGEAPLYHVERIILEKRQFFRDGEHIIYVNGAYRNAETAIGRLMHDMHSEKADDMYSRELAESVRKYKEDDEEVASMSGVMEELIEEAEKRGMQKGMQLANESANAKASMKRKEHIISLLRKNKNPEDIHEFCDYPLDLILEVQRELETNICDEAK